MNGMSLVVACGDVGGGGLLNSWSLLRLGFLRQQAISMANFPPTHCSLSCCHGVWWAYT